MSDEFKTVAEVANQLAKELQVDISESKIRRWETEGVITAKRDEDSDYRLFSKVNIDRLKIAIIMSELGLSLDDVKLYLDNPTKPEYVAKIFQRITVLKSLCNKLEYCIGRESL